MTDHTIEIHVRDNSEENDLLCKTRGYRRDVFVKIGEQFYQMTVFSYAYLKQFLQNQYRLETVYCLEANLLVVESVTAENIVATVLKQAELHYFDALKACQIENGTIIYPLDAQTKAEYLARNWETSIPVDRLIRLY